jgi:hypothetical protein
MLYRILPAVTVFGCFMIGCGDNAHVTGAPPTPDAPLTPDAPPTPDAATTADFSETFSSTSMDLGNWGLTTQANRARMINPTGGDPDGYLYGEVSSSIPTWATASTRYQPGVGDEFKRDSVFVGDYYTHGINHVSADLQIYQVGVWTPDRGVTLHMMSWDDASNSVAFDAFYTVLDLPDVPTGWAHYDIEVDARSATVPPGWAFSRGDGTPGTDADWAIFMHQIDLVGFGFWKPDVGYPNRGIWQLGIDNIHVGAQPQ